MLKPSGGTAGNHLTLAFAAALVAWLLPVATAMASVHAGALFKDNAILQCEMPVNVYGTASPGEQVGVSYARSGFERNATATADEQGRWLAVLDAMPASAEPATLTITGPDNHIALHNILVGEVWLAAGQSNMQMSFDWEGGVDVSHLDQPLIRWYSIPPWYSAKPIDDYPKGRWSAGAVGESALYFSQVSYYFAVGLREALDIPVGMLPVAFSGTRIRSWMSRDALESDPAAGAALTQPGSDANSPAACYNRMIHPILRHTFRGVIWYQGESDATGDRPQQYRSLFPTLIRSWRHDFESPRLPFYFVQLPQYNAGPDHDWVAVRQAQAMGLSEPFTGMAVTIDSSATASVHPQNKPLVGQRLARLALRRTYQQEQIVDSGPTLHSAQIDSSGSVRVGFDHADGGLMGDDELNGFELAGEDGEFYVANAALSPDRQSVQVSSTRVPNPISIRYAWKNFLPKQRALSLSNAAGLPAAPFIVHTLDPQ